MSRDELILEYMKAMCDSRSAHITVLRDEVIPYLERWGVGYPERLFDITDGDFTKITKETTDELRRIIEVIEL